jgi:hypothetical protein
MTTRDGGKGDTPRPLGVPMDVFDENFDRIFGKKEKKQPDIEVEINAENDEQDITIKKTWEF